MCKGKSEMESEMRRRYWSEMGRMERSGEMPWLERTQSLWLTLSIAAPATLADPTAACTQTMRESASLPLYAQRWVGVTKVAGLRETQRGAARSHE